MCTIYLATQLPSHLKKINAIAHFRNLILLSPCMVADGYMLTIEMIPPDLRQNMLVYIVIKNILAQFNQIFSLTSSI